MYDHDNSIPNIPIIGAIEVNDDSGDVLLTASFSVNSALNNNKMGAFVFLAASEAVL